MTGYCDGWARKMLDICGGDIVALSVDEIPYSEECAVSYDFPLILRPTLEE